MQTDKTDLAFDVEGKLAKRSSIPPETLSADTKRLYDVLNEESDLAAILIGTSFIDACLLSVLEKKLLEGSTADRLLSHNGRLGSFMARAEMCYVLGLIPKSWYSDFTVMAEIRNAVAHHHLSLSFNNPEIADRCAQLSTHLQGEASQSTGRTRFVLCVVVLANSLILKALTLKDQGAIRAAKEPSHTYVKMEPSREA